MTDAPLDLVIKNARVVRPRRPAVEPLDLGVRDGRFARVEPGIPAADARQVYDARGRLAFPGIVDAHTHAGIYAPLEQDAVTESRAAVSGGVTTMLTYVRTGQYYLNRGGSYAKFFPEVLRLSQGRYHCDYGYHLAPIAAAHIDEMEALATTHGVPSFKIFMFYGGYGLHGTAGADEQRRFLMIGPEDSYDLAHFEFIMRAAARIRREHKHLAPQVSVSLHCEMADILNAYTRLVRRDTSLTGLKAYSAARPPHAEGLAVCVAAYLAQETECVNVNLLHLSSRKALEAALMMAQVMDHVDFRREITVGHLLLDDDAPTAAWAKVNPPIRPRADVEYLWRAVLDGKVDWIVSDHACCAEEVKQAGRAGQGDIWLAKSGFGGTEYLLAGLYSEGSKRGLPLHRMAELVSWNPARRYGLGAKGDIAVGYDADVALLDPDRSFTVRAADSASAQGYTPFEGQHLAGRVTATFLRGVLAYDDGAVVGPARGRFIPRPSPSVGQP
ncbi:MAG TPA: dihydroorotase family protein [Methylomirabilota bacterium]|nr:dihydroorotase family protein [Methylomirabilota bacterium]